MSKEHNVLRKSTVESVGREANMISQEMLTILTFNTGKHVLQLRHWTLDVMPYSDFNSWIPRLYIALTNIDGRLLVVRWMLTSILILILNDREQLLDESEGRTSEYKIGLPKVSTKIYEEIYFVQLKYVIISNDSW